MSALLVDDLIVPLPTRLGSTAWRHVEPGQSRPHLAAVPAPAAAPVRTPTPVATRPSTGPLRLTDRGIAVIVVFFLALIATAAVVLVTSFLSVSNEPTPVRGEVPGLVSSQG